MKINLKELDISLLYGGYRHLKGRILQISFLNTNLLILVVTHRLIKNRDFSEKAHKQIMKNPK